MFEVTGSATAELKKVLEGLDSGESTYLRLAVTQQGLGVVLDEQRPGDKAVKDGDTILLVVDEATAKRLSDRTMDFDETAEQLVFT